MNLFLVFGKEEINLPSLMSSENVQSPRRVIESEITEEKVLFPRSGESFRKEEVKICTKSFQPYYDLMAKLQTNQQFSRNEFIDNSMVVLTDVDEDNMLEMYCYCHGLETDQMDTITQECRGLVYDSQGQLVSRAFGHTPTYTPKTLPADLKEFFSDHFDACIFYPSVEGSLVRAFYYQSNSDNEGDWYLTTHRKLEAYRSFWACRSSFGKLFDQALSSHFLETNNQEFKDLEGTDLVNAFLKSLDKEKQYVFLIQNTLENRIVCVPPKNPKVLYVGTFQKGMMIPNDPSVPVLQQEALSFTNLDQVLSFVETIPSEQWQGVIVFAPNGKQYKICSSEYMELFNLRNNNPSVMARYLQIRTDSKTRLVYEGLYPEWKERMNLYESTLKRIASNLYNHYVSRFIKKEQVENLPEQEYKVVSNVHAWYKARCCRGNYSKVELQNFEYQLNQCSSPDLNKMIRRQLDSEKDSQ